METATLRSRAFYAWQQWQGRNAEAEANYIARKRERAEEDIRFKWERDFDAATVPGIVLGDETEEGLLEFFVGADEFAYGHAEHAIYVKWQCPKCGKYHYFFVGGLAELGKWWDGGYGEQRCNCQQPQELPTPEPGAARESTPLEILGDALLNFLEEHGFVRYGE